MFLLSWQNLVLDRGENGSLHKKCVVVKVLHIKEFCLEASKFSSTPNLSLCGIFVLPPVGQIPSAKVNFS